MKARNITTMVGSFCLSFGALIIINDVPPWAWWTGQAMIILGPILMSVRAATAEKQEEIIINKAKDTQP